MSGLYVKLDVEYASDEKMIEAGPMAELLYVRGLAFCKKNPHTDGNISFAQLAVVAVGIPTPKRQAARLSEVGAWTQTDRGWHITAWLKRNRSAADIEAQREMASALGIQGNHDRWHVGPEGKPSTKCPICVGNYRRNGSPTRSGNPTNPDRESDSDLSPEEEEEPKEKPEPKPEPKPQEKPSSSSVELTLVATQPDDDDDRITRAIDIHARTVSQGRTGYARTVRTNDRTEHGHTLRQYLRRYPDATAEELAVRVLNVSPGDLYALTNFVDILPDRSA